MTRRRRVLIGLGGVGLSAVMGASLAGAARIVAVDRVAGKLDLASSLGATAGSAFGAMHGAARPSRRRLGSTQTP